MPYSIRILISLLLFAATATAQDLQLESGAVGSYLRLKELQTRGSVLHVVAHPDDEDGAMLAYCARGLGARTMLFSITRGEGGANLISSHFFDELGALRTLEHQKAASYYGIELFYSRAADYGYSKTLDEAMKQWQNGIPVLRDLVEVIRRERPTVMLSRFAGDPRDGHGHHQMAGFVSRLAFDAAANPHRFPEQIQQGLKPWQVQKLYVRSGSPWRAPKEGDWTIALPTGEYDPVIGKSYSQVARFGLGFQRSQGMSGHHGESGPRASYYRLIQQAGDREIPTSEDSLFEGTNIRLSSLLEHPESMAATHRRLLEIESGLRRAMQQWSPAAPEKTLDILLDQLESLRAIMAAKNVKDGESADAASALHSSLERLEQDIEEAIISVAGIQFEAWATDLDGQAINHAVGDTFNVNARIANASSHSLQLGSLTVEGGQLSQSDSTSPAELATGEAVQSTLLFVPTAKPTVPHWSRPSIGEPMYKVANDGQQRPSPPNPFLAKWSVTLRGNEIDLTSIVETRIRHPEYGNVRYPLTAAPAMSVRFTSQNSVVATETSELRLPVVVKSSVATAKATVELDLPVGWSATPAVESLTFDRADEERTVEFQVTMAAGTTSSEQTIRANVQYKGQSFKAGFETVSARDVGRMNIYHDAKHHVRRADFRIAGNPAVGYIEGSGDEVATSLKAFGITPTILSPADLASGDLSRFDVIVVGVRAYAVREDIRTHNARLLDFVKRGGTLIVQYQTPEFDENFGPFPYEMGRRPEEVSEEDSAVTMLEPNHVLLTTPNRISPADFEGWFEQRGSKFWSTWDDNYVPLLECHDTGQSPQKGGQLVARFGKGHYIYSAYAWYRQLPNGVPGAYRLFANMLSLPKTGTVE